MRIPLAREGLSFILPFLILTIAAAALSIWWIAAFLLLLTLFCINFFRDPERRTPGDPGLVVSPADGTILSAGPAPAGEAPEELTQKIVIFMSVFNCHVNRAPISGVIESYSYHPGKMLAAFSPKASVDNEQNRIEIVEGARRVLFKQIAGALARRIVFRKKAGDAVARGDRVGMIRFGSRVDVFLPSAATVQARRGEKVTAGVSILAHLPEVP